MVIRYLSDVKTNARPNNVKRSKKKWRNLHLFSIFTPYGLGYENAMQTIRAKDKTIGKLQRAKEKKKRKANNELLYNAD